MCITWQFSGINGKSGYSIDSNTENRSLSHEKMTPTISLRVLTVSLLLLLTAPLTTGVETSTALSPLHFDQSQTTRTKQPVSECRGYFDVMGHYEDPFNCTKDPFIYCCGTCHYRFCCPLRSRQIDQENCQNYQAPEWATTQIEPLSESSRSPQKREIQTNAQPAALKSKPKALNNQNTESAKEVLETPPRSLPQVMFPKNLPSSETLPPPLGEAQVATIRPQLMYGWMDECRGYFDVMGHYDASFNCTKGTFIYCCGTCHYRFCCPDRSRQLDQKNCNNYHSPDWAKTQIEPLSESSRSPQQREIQTNAQPAALKSKPKALNNQNIESAEEVLETPPRPLPQVMFPKNVTSSEALAPPLGAAQVAPIRPRLMDGWMDACRGYFDVMGHYDGPFNCTKDTFIYCCGTCHYRFCCPDRSRQLDQENCKNYHSPDWAKTQTETMFIPDDQDPSTEVDPLKLQSHNTGIVIGAVVVFMIVVAVGIKVVFNKVQQEAINRDLNMPRALVDMLRHQSSPVQQDERNNSVAITVADGTGTLGRTQKNLYAPGLPSKDNRLENLQHNFIHPSNTSPKHTATIERSSRMNNAQLAAGGTLLSSKHNNIKSQPSFHHSLHNLAQLPPSYESATKPELNRYSSLKRLEKGLDEYSSGYCTTKRRPHTAQPALQSSSHHLHWGGDYTLSGRGTLPRHAIRPWIPPPPSGAVPVPASPTPNPYPLDPPEPQFNPNYDTLSKPRKVKSTDQLLNMGEVPGNTGTLSRMSKNQQHQYYKNKNSNTQTLTRKTQERERQERQERQDRPDRQDRQGRDRQDRDRQDRDRLDRDRPDRDRLDRDRPDRDRPDRDRLDRDRLDRDRPDRDRPDRDRQDRQRDERMLMSPDHLEERMGVGMGVVDPYAHTPSGVVPTLPRQQKAQSQQNVSTPSLDRHHMIKMNSHPTSGREQERSTPMPGHMGGGMGWAGEPPAQGGVVMGTGTLGGHSARRMAFATKRQNTIEQLHFIPGGGSSGSSGSGGGSQGIRTGSKNEVTV